MDQPLEVEKMYADVLADRMAVTARELRRAADQFDTAAADVRNLAVSGSNTYGGCLSGPVATLFWALPNAGIHGLITDAAAADIARAARLSTTPTEEKP